MQGTDAESVTEAAPNNDTPITPSASVAASCEPRREGRQERRWLELVLQLHDTPRAQQDHSCDAKQPACMEKLCLSAPLSWQDMPDLLV
jgi:hypothetical protein